MTNRHYHFSLVELLVVIAILSILASLMLPALTRAKQAAYRAKCISNMRQIGIGFIVFADDNDQRLPGHDNTDSRQTLEDHQMAWAGINGSDSDIANGVMAQLGYLTSSDVHQCPATPTKDGLDYSNHYSAPSAFNGARITRLPADTEAFSRSMYEDDTLRTPLLVEELDDDFDTQGRFWTHYAKINNAHNHGANYVALDGSVYWLETDPGWQTTTSEAAIYAWKIRIPRLSSAQRLFKYDYESGVGTIPYWGWFHREL